MALKPEARDRERQRIAQLVLDLVKERGAEIPKITSEPVRAPSQLGTATVAEPVSSTRPAGETAPPVQAEQPVAWPEPPAEGSRPIFGRKEKVDFTSTLTAIRRGDQQAMMFLLANQQVWMQNAPRDLPFKEGEEIRIKSGTVGGYIMRNDNGTSTRVKRVR